MSSAAHRVKLTYEDFLHFPEDGKRHELVEGEHCATPSPCTRHQIIAGNLYWLLRGHVERRGGGTVFLAPLDVVLSEFDVVEPDLIFVSEERAGVITAKNLQGAPDLLVEILSDSSRLRDERTKRALYDRFDVREYWIIDPELETIKIFRRGETGFERVTDLAREADDVLRSPLFPDLALRLADVFASPDGH